MTLAYCSPSFISKYLSPSLGYNYRFYHSRLTRSIPAFSFFYLPTSFLLVKIFLFFCFFFFVCTDSSTVKILQVIFYWCFTVIKVEIFYCAFWHICLYANKAIWVVIFVLPFALVFAHFIHRIIWVKFRGVILSGSGIPQLLLCPEITSYKCRRLCSSSAQDFDSCFRLPVFYLPDPPFFADSFAKKLDIDQASSRVAIYCFLPLFLKEQSLGTWRAK